jgi:hypothetical protein
VILSIVKGEATEESGGEGGFEPRYKFWLVQRFSNSPIPQPGVRKKRLSSGELPYFGAKHPCLGPVVQPEFFNGLSRRCTPTTSANDGVSCGCAILLDVARKWSSLNTKAFSGPILGPITFNFLFARHSGAK